MDCSGTRDVGPSIGPRRPRSVAYSHGRRPEAPSWPVRRCVRGGLQVRSFAECKLMLRAGIGAFLLVLAGCSPTSGGGAFPPTGAIAISAGMDFTCALTASGGVDCWGRNPDGQLGDGTTTNRLTPVPVVGLSGPATAIATGFQHTCALIAGGDVNCWGGNWAGQLGDNSTTNRWTPAPVVGLPGPATAISVGGYHTCALVAGGDLHCWGANAVGQLGDGSTTDRLTPVPVVG